MDEPKSEIQLQTSQFLSQGSDLLSRVSSFLPKLKEANENLDDNDVSDKIDFDLEKHEDDESDDNSESPDDNDSTVNEKQNDDNKSIEQVIELKIAMGDMSEDPVFYMLGDDDASDANDSESESDESDQSTRSGDDAIHSLMNRKRTILQDVPDGKSTSKTSKTTPLIQVIRESNESSLK